MRGQKDGLAFAFQPQDQFAGDAGTGRVLPGRWFVEKQQFGIVQQCAAKVEPHLHALGKGFDPLIGGVLKIDHREDFFRRSCGAVIKRREELQVFAGGQAQIECRQFEADPDALIDGAAERGDIFSKEASRTGKARQKTHQDFLSG